MLSCLLTVVWSWASRLFAFLYQLWPRTGSQPDGTDWPDVELGCSEVTPVLGKTSVGESAESWVSQHNSAAGSSAGCLEPLDDLCEKKPIGELLAVAQDLELLSGYEATLHFLLSRDTSDKLKLSCRTALLCVQMAQQKGEETWCFCSRAIAAAGVDSYEEADRSESATVVVDAETLRHMRAFASKLSVSVLSQLLNRVGDHLPLHRETFGDCRRGPCAVCGEQGDMIMTFCSDKHALRMACARKLLPRSLRCPSCRCDWRQDMIDMFESRN